MQIIYEYYLRYSTLECRTNDEQWKTNSRRSIKTQRNSSNLKGELTNITQ